MTRPSQTAAITKDSRARKSVTTSHILSSLPFSIKEAWILTWVRWFFGGLVWHSLHLLAFWIKSLFFPPVLLLSNLLACHVASSTRLDSITRPHRFSVSTAHDPRMVYGHPRCITRNFYWCLNSDWPSSATVLSLGVKEKKESEVTQSCPSLRPHGLQPTRLLRPWDAPGKNIGVGCHFLLQGIFPTQGLNPGLPHCKQTL